MWIYKRIKLIECGIIRHMRELGGGMLAVLIFPCPFCLFVGDGQHRDPHGAQHPDDGGSGFHRHKLVRESCVPGLFGCKSLSSMESSPAGLVCWGGNALLSAPRRRGAQLCPTGSAGGVPEGMGDITLRRFKCRSLAQCVTFRSQQLSSVSNCCASDKIQIKVFHLFVSVKLYRQRNSV